MGHSQTLGMPFTVIETLQKRKDGGLFATMCRKLSKWVVKIRVQEVYEAMLEYRSSKDMRHMTKGLRKIISYGDRI